MGRKSRFSEKEWEAIDRRLLEGEAARAIATELGCSEAIIRARKKARVEKIKDAANQVVAADRALKGLDLPAQRAALTFAQRLQAMGDGLAEAGMLGAQNAADLKFVGRGELAKALAFLEKGDVKSAGEALERVKQLGALANDEADIAVRLTTSQREAVREAQKVPPADAPDLRHASVEDLKALERVMNSTPPAQ
jgi:hypothetical protein